MSIAVDSHITTPVAVAHQAPEPYVEVRASHPVATNPVKHGDANDTVKLSLSAQIHLLKSQGQSTKQIASNLGVDTATVNSYLGTAVVAATASASAPIPAVTTK